jgi:hypothetical protein
MRRLSIQRTLQCVGGRPVEFGVKTRNSRRCIDLGETTVDVLRAWRRQLRRDGFPCGVDDWTFCNTAGRFFNPESLSRLCDRIVQRAPAPRIRFHDLRHSHASLLIAAGVRAQPVRQGEIVRVQTCPRSIPYGARGSARGTVVRGRFCDLTPPPWCRTGLSDPACALTGVAGRGRCSLHARREWVQRIDVGVLGGGSTLSSSREPTLLGT